MSPLMSSEKSPLLTAALLKAGLCGCRTVTVKFCVALIAGVPLSKTFTAMKLVEGDSAMAGRQEKIPLVGLIAAPTGGASKLQVSVCAGKSGSVAGLAAVKVTPAMRVEDRKSGAWGTCRE